METKYTPGPWLISDQGKPATFVYALNPHGYNKFWTLVQGGGNSITERTTDEELEANARLIAAAPELLEACAAIVAWCDKNPPAGDALYCINQARAAIAKAEGR